MHTAGIRNLLETKRQRSGCTFVQCHTAELATLHGFVQKCPLDNTLRSLLVLEGTCALAGWEGVGRLEGVASWKADSYDSASSIRNSRTNLVVKSGQGFDICWVKFEQNVATLGTKTLPTYYHRQSPVQIQTRSESPGSKYTLPRSVLRCGRLDFYRQIRYECVHWVLNNRWIPVHWVFEFNWIVQIIFWTIKLK
jgi:hypothetical protein